MPDLFFATKTRKRKRTSSKDSGPSSKKILKTSNGRVSAKGKGKARTADEELHSGGSGSEALDDMDLRVDKKGPNESGDEDAGETPAKKRLRLAKLYVGSIKEGLNASLSPRLLQSWRLSLYFLSGWRGGCGGDRQGVNICSTRAGCHRTCGQATFICARFCECRFVVCGIYVHVPTPHPL